MKTQSSKHILLAILFLAACTVASAQTSPSSIASADDYVRVRESITSVSQKLVLFAQHYPAYTFSPEYDAAGAVIAMHVDGVSNANDAQQIEQYLLELETLGEMIRTMSSAHLPAETKSSKETTLSESEAKNYVPVYEESQQKEMLTSAKKK